MKKIYFLLVAILFLLSNAYAGVNFNQLDKPLYNLYISFDIEKNFIEGEAKIKIPSAYKDKEIKIFINTLKIKSVTVDGNLFRPKIEKDTLTVKGKGLIEITYEGIFREEDVSENIENRGVISGNVISKKGVCLTNGWYPKIMELSYYKLEADVPKDFLAISEAEEVEIVDLPTGKKYLFDFLHPLTGINFIAGKYIEIKEIYNGIDIYGYFFPEDISLAKTYIEFTKKYINMYENLLTPYPYKRFSIVENFLSTGYSMPTFTLLGQDVIRLPFIVETSLGHEVLHQWFGNLVYVNHEGGNWSEGLTVYLSDHLYKEQENKGWEYRKKLITDYESYVTPEKEFPLKDFKGRFDFSSRAIGYGKGAMVFHMLKKNLGDDLFYSGLKKFIEKNKFREASWLDIKNIFKEVSNKDLDWFFSQWIDRKGIPSIEIKDARVNLKEGNPVVSFEVVQKSDPYNLSLTLDIKSDKEEISRVVEIKNIVKKFEIPVRGNPLNMIFDQNYDIMRRLSEKEYPPVISRLLGDETRLIVIPEKDAEKYTALIDILKEQGFGIKNEKEITDNDIKNSSLLVLGSEGSILRRLFGRALETEKRFTLEMKKNPLNTSKVIAIIQSDTKEEVESVARKIIHYGNYSLLKFEGGRNIEKKTEETIRGIKVDLYKPALIMKPIELTNVDKIINSIIDKPIIYVGERHTNYGDHKIQLNVIRSLYERGKKFAIGMEMFQIPFQEVVNDYISDKIDEKEFLKKTEYFQRWKFDYIYYKEIIDYAKIMNIPIIALNVRSEILKKVSDGGLDSLSETEKKEIPQDMDMSDEEYKMRLKDIFEQHKNHDSRNFDHFYQSQILWDETMAHSIADFIDKNPDYQIVVIAGVGHIMFDSGIPKRVYRLNNKDYVTLIPHTEYIDNDIADFVFFAEHISPPSYPKLGIVIKEEDKYVKIEKLVPGGIAKSAGLEVGDILVSFDDWKIEGIEDVKIFMIGKKFGEEIKIKVLRKKFLTGYKEIELKVVL